MTMQIIHEYDDAGLHRLVIDNMPGTWSVYKDPAVHPEGYMAFTDYHGERVIRFTTIPLRQYRVLTAEAAKMSDDKTNDQVRYEEHQAMWTWIEDNSVAKVKGLWEAHSFGSLFTISRVTLEDAVFTAMVIERLLKERGL